MNCPLCQSSHTSLYDQDEFRHYHQCGGCELIFVPRSELVSSSEEKFRYDQHENHPDDPRYREYLKKIVDSIHPFLKPTSRGLDFGCGESTLLEQLFVEAGFPTRSYDLFYQNDESVLHEKYDFIILSEVIEHLREPREIMLQLKEQLNPGGVFGIKTRLQPLSKTEFSRWYYKKDPTHIQFFNPKSFEKLNEVLGLNVFRNIGNDLYLLTTEVR